MKKLIFTLILGICAIISLNSCTTYAYSQDTPYDYQYSYNNDVDMNIVIRMGTPYYFENSIIYYLYNGWYYYPYFYNGHYYYYRYRTPFPMRPGYRFIPRHHERPYAHHGGRFGHKPSHHPQHGHHTTPHRHDNGQQHRMNTQPRPVIPHTQGTTPQHRPQGNFGTQRRSSTYHTAPRTISPSRSSGTHNGGSRGHFGGGRR